MKKYKPSKKAVLLISFTTILICVAITYLSLRYLSSVNKILMWTVVLIFWVIGIFVGFVLTPRYFKKTNFFVGEKEITVESYFFLSTRQTLKVEKIGQTTCVSVPLLDCFDFNFLVLNLIGGKSVLPFLSANDMNEIYKMIECDLLERG